MKRLAVASLLLTALTSCASVGDYLSDRGGDLVDGVRAKLMFGFGLGVKVDATQWVQLGWIQHDSLAVGLHNRGIGYWDEQVSSWGLVVGDHQETTTGIDHYGATSVGKREDWVPAGRMRQIENKILAQISRALATTQPTE